MPIMQEPKPLPSPLDYVPEGTVPYRVSNNDNWWTLAERPEVRASLMSANDLCYLNFRTRKPAEINWYLHHKVGCRKPTRDGKNYVFSLADSPGIVYLPKPAAPPPVTEVEPKKPEPRSNAWFGIGVKGGTQFFVIGIETLTGYVASLDDLGKGMALGASINRLGPGVGASGGLCFIFITGVDRPERLNGHQQGDFDFNAALGGNWGKMAQGVVKLQKIQPLIKVIDSLGARTPGALKTALKAHPDKWVELIKAGKSVNEFLGIEANGGPNVFVFDAPVGGGVEASVFYGLSNYNALWDFTD
jgi:hypothetical protein